MAVKTGFVRAGLHANGTCKTHVTQLLAFAHENKQKCVVNSKKTLDKKAAGQ
jgi:hypothetical protein